MLVGYRNASVMAKSSNLIFKFLSLYQYGAGHDCKSCVLGHAEFDSQAADIVP